MCKDDYIEIKKDDKRIYIGSIENYLNDKKSINGIVKEWFMYVENWDYPVMSIEITTKQTKTEKISEYMIKEGSENTTSGNYIFYLEELADRFNVCFDCLKDNIDKIIENVQMSKIVSHIDYNSDSTLSVYFYTDYCLNFIEDIEFVQ